METIGEILRKARQEKKVTLEEVSKKTKIHLNILRALEEDRFEGLNPVYVKGFLKIYGQYLGINQEDLVKQYQTEFASKKQVTLIKQAKEEFREPLLKIFILALFKNFKVLAVVMFCVILLFGFSILLKEHQKKIALHKTVSTLKPITIKSKPEAVPTKTVFTTKPIVVKPLPVKQEALIPITAALRAKEDTWIQVKLDGKVIFQGTLKKGRSENWRAKQTIELSIGNAGGVELEVNGKLLSPLGRRGQALKKVLINKEGLSIK